ADLNWSDKTVIGNGFSVTAAAGYTGRVIIQGSRVTGLGTFSTTGIDVNTTGLKVVQGNRIGVGMLQITNGSNWQIGGIGAGEGNVLIGARSVLHIVNSSHDTIQGNYLHHDYHGGFSQGYNIWFEGSGDALVEHNVIKDGSWPVQSVGGEFRYNLVV